MLTRNFWIEASIDGRRTRLSGGPRGEKGGMTLVLWQRVKGEKVRVAALYCNESDGWLTSHIGYGPDLARENIICASKR